MLSDITRPVELQLVRAVRPARVLMVKGGHVRAVRPDMYLCPEVFVFHVSQIIPRYLEMLHARRVLPVKYRPVTELLV